MAINWDEALRITTNNSVYHLGPITPEGVRKIERERRGLCFEFCRILGPSGDTSLVDEDKPLEVGRGMALMAMLGRDRLWVTSPVMSIENE